MSAGTVTWLVIGAAAGALHATGLRHAAHQSVGRGGLPRRLFFVSALLIVAALEGRILPAAGGWAAGLAVLAILFLVRQRQWM